MAEEMAGRTDAARARYRRALREPGDAAAAREALTRIAPR
jgi:hypothetical protein